MTSVLEINVPNVPIGEQPASGFCGYLAGDENRVTAETIAAMFQSPTQTRGAGRVLLFGGAGLGKSHLARGVAWKWEQCHVDCQVVCTSATDFYVDLADSIERREGPAFRRRLHQADFFVLDDLQHLTGKAAAQRELRLLLDVCDDRGAPVLLTANEHPALLTGLDSSLRARLLAGVVLRLSPPATSTRTALAARLAAEVDASVEPGELTRIAKASATAEGLRQAIRLHRTALGNSTANQSELENQTPTLAEVVRRTADEFGVAASAIQGKSRRKSIALARHATGFLARVCTRHSLATIGATLGGRDHTTVMHSVQTIRKRMAEDPVLKRRIDRLAESLNGAVVGADDEPLADPDRAGKSG